MINKKFINYSNYTKYNDHRGVMMEHTTIQLSKKMKKKLASFGNKNETYEEIINKLYNAAVKHQLRDFLMSSEECVSIEDAMKEADRKWPE